MGPQLKMATLNHIKHKSIGSNAFALKYLWGSVLTCTTGEDDVDEVVDYNLSGMSSPQLPFFVALA